MGTIHQALKGQKQFQLQILPALNQQSKESSQKNQFDKPQKIQQIAIFLQLVPL